MYAHRPYPMSAVMLLVFLAGFLPIEVTLATSLNVPPRASCETLSGDGRLTLYSYPHRELLDVRYRDVRGVLQEKALATIAHLMRSPDGRTAPIDPRLVRLLDHLQDHFGAEVVEIISGYRSSEYNAQLQAEGRAVATESEHLQGRAADVHFDEITEGALRDYATTIHCGGIGFYPALHFVHLDLGPRRHWEEAAGARRLVGERPLVITTDKNYYAVGERVVFSLPDAVAGAWTLEWFHRGAWHRHRHFTMPPTSLTWAVSIFPYGKYRLVSDGTPTAYSNEFYLKKGTSYTFSLAEDH
ncbi:MAG: YcbK family protein [Deltaproteobacteria bacterium]|nr:YcbK family protein [Deltaproteobacteria bacterium]